MLIVETAGFAPGVLSPPVLNSDQLRVVERFSLDAEKMLLNSELHRGGSDLLQGAVHRIRRDRRGRPAVQTRPLQGARVPGLLEGDEEVVPPECGHYLV